MLKKLAEETGGQWFFPGGIEDCEPEFADIVSGIPQRIEYLVSGHQPGGGSYATVS